jgi:hypothetical protein
MYLTRLYHPRHFENQQQAIILVSAFNKEKDIIYKQRIMLSSTNGKDISLNWDVFMTRHNHPHEHTCAQH